MKTVIIVAPRYSPSHLSSQRRLPRRMLGIAALEQLDDFNTVKVAFGRNVNIMHMPRHSIANNPGQF